MGLLAFVISVIALLFSILALARSGVKRVTVPLRTEPNLFCGCDHHLAMHDPEKGSCADEEWVEFYDRSLEKNMRRRESCKCKQYTGDQPVDRFFSPRIV